MKLVTDALSLTICKIFHFLELVRWVSITIVYQVVRTSGKKSGMLAEGHAP